MQEKEFKKKLKERSKQIEIDLSDEQLNKFYRYKELLIDWNTKINLTAITDEEDIINKHFIDSITINKYIGDKKEVIDIGTGAGFPGIPLNIVNSSNKITLFDSLQKRLNVLEDIISNIELIDIFTLHGRAEETFKNKEYREKYDVATSRAVASLNVLVEYMLPAVKVGGLCICMKSNEIEDEISLAKNAINILGGKIQSIEEILLPGTNIKRNIIIIRKIKNTPNKYPRKPGTPSKQPL